MNVSPIVIAALAVGQLFLLIFTFGIAREVFLLKGQRRTGEIWPLVRLAPGDPLPDMVREAAGYTTSSGALLFVCAMNADGLVQLTGSLKAVCEKWGRRVIVLAESASLAELCSSVGIPAPDIFVMSKVSQEFGTTSNTIICAHDNRLVEASALALTPSSIRDRFYFVGE